MKRIFTDLLIRPDEFFANLMGEKESLKVPILILLILGLISAVTAYFVSAPSARMMSGLMSEMTPGMGDIIQLVAIPAALLGVMIVWVIWTAVFFALSFAFRGKGKFTRSLELIGYGYIPQIFGSLIALAVSFAYIPKVQIPQLSAAAVQDPQMITDAVKALQHDPAMMQYNMIISLVSIIFMLWSANYWIFGLRHARSLPLRDAAICVIIPVIGAILITLYSLAVM